MLARTLTVAACVAISSAWSYDRCDTASCPDAWSHSAAACSGTQQSPINLCGAVPIPRSGDNYKITARNYNVKHTVQVTNTGHTVQLTEQAPIPVLRIPKLNQLVGRSQSGGQSNPEWNFAQMHLHFGREFQSNEGSEHTVDGRRYPAEFHLVHFNKARGVNLTQALASGAKDAVLVVGVLFELGDIESELIKRFATLAPGLTPPPTTANSSAPLARTVALSDVFTASDAFYAYGGSLTTPGCNEQVTWVVMRTPKTITAESLEKLKTVMETATEPIAHMGNYRPVQPLGTRTVYTSYSPSATPTVCQPFPVPEPCYICSQAPPVNGDHHLTRRTPLDASETSSLGFGVAPSWMTIAGVAIPSTLAVVGVVALIVRRQTQPTEQAIAHIELQEVQ